MDYSRILQRFVKLRKCKNCWSARCPAHEDTRNSLILWIDDRTRDLRALCLARGCKWEQIVAATRTEKADWFAAGKGGRRMAQLQTQRVIATYDYVDEGGVLLYQKLRYEPKSFMMRRPDGEGWAWNLNGVEPVLYRLPDLLDPDQFRKPVLLVEGEKACDSLRAFGFVSTTSGGTNSWRMEFGHELAGRRVVILPDNDGPGQVYAAQVAGCLVWHGAESIRIVNLPGVPTGGDPWDWLVTVQKGKSMEEKKAELIRLVKGFPEWRCEAA